MLKRVSNKIKRNIYFLILNLISRFSKYSIKIESVLVGTSYGCWKLPSIHENLNLNGVCLTGGVGEDLSFEYHLANKTSLTFQLYDFTPRSKDYFDNFVISHNNGKQIIAEGTLLEPKKFDINRFQFIPKGLSLNSKNIEFYPPINPVHVSFSSIKNGNKPVIFPTLNLFDVIEKVDLNNRSILKLDIEGSEYELLNDKITNESIFTFDIVLLELDYLRYCSLIKGIIYLSFLFKNSNNYKMFYNDGYNIGFIKNDILK